MAGNDFVQVQLTAAGIALANGHPLRISNGRRSLTFQAGESTRVELSYEWNALLKNYHSTQGDLLFQLVPTPAAPAPTAGTTAAAPILVPAATVPAAPVSAAASPAPTSTVKES